MEAAPGARCGGGRSGNGAGEGSVPGRKRGPHVVMLVDNLIVGDSRVQKQARSMAERGWRVTLVGRRTRETHPDRARFGGVPARLVHVPWMASSKPQPDRPPPLRSPLAYSSPRKALRHEALADRAIREARLAIDLRKRAGTDRGPVRYWSRARLRYAERRRGL